MHIWSGVKNLNQKLPILHVSVYEGNLTGFNIFTIFIDLNNEKEKLKNEVNELKSKIFLFF